MVRIVSLSPWKKRLMGAGYDVSLVGVVLFPGCWIISTVMKRRSWGWPSASTCPSIKTAGRSFTVLCNTIP